MNLLAEIGEALYGERWQTALAHELGVADRTVRRWVAGDSPVPPCVASPQAALPLAAHRFRGASTGPGRRP